MQTQLADEFRNTREGEQAEAILRQCVHCGFCLATCPTYVLLGDELDSPRGRIYLMKQVLEGAAVTRKTQLHLDRCLTCRNCETTCPSGVAYGRLVDIGRRIVDERVERALADKLVRRALGSGLTSPLFKPALALGRSVRALLPAALAAKIPPRSGASAHRWPQREHARKVLLLMGCVQPALMPNINSATARVLDAAGIQTLVADGARCCGALRTHLGDVAGGLADARRNIDAWWPLVQGLTAQGKVEAIVMNASACGLAVKEYGQALAHDPEYAERAARVSALARDLSELLPEIVPALAGRLRGPRTRKLAWHPPCTLQHGQRLTGQVEQGLRALGFEVDLPAESHLCCGSAGTYSLLQPELAAIEPEAIVSANIGCIQHLQAGTATPVRHWVEVLDEALA